MNLADLRIYGYGSISDLLAAAIFSGEPACLVGEKGTAKTFLCSQLAKALAVNFISYNASTINFEDVVGYPIPHKNEDGSWDKMDFIPTKNSIWGRQFILIDELNRARIDRQNDLLQLIRNRAVQGMPVPGLKWVWAAVNPLSYEGTSAMDEAMADRFSWIIRVPAFLQIQHEERLAIIHNVTDDDMPALSHWDDKLSEKQPIPAMDFVEFFKRVAVAYQEVKREYANAVGEYVEQIILALSKNKEGKLFVDGRRAGMIKRNILCLAAVKKAKAGSVDIESAAVTALHNSFPNELIGEPVKAEHLQAAHQIAKDFLRSEESRELIKIMAIENEIERIAAIFSHKLNPMDASNVLITYFNGLSSWQKEAFSVALVPKIIGKYEEKLTSDTLAQLTTKVNEVAEHANRTHSYIRDYNSANIAVIDSMKKPFYHYVGAIYRNSSGSYGTPTAGEGIIARFLADHMVAFRKI